MVFLGNQPEREYLRLPGPGECELCGCSPALGVAFRSVRGLAIAHQVVTVRGRLCRDCGLAHGRERMARTMVGGWWSIGGFLATPILLVLNLQRLRRVELLAAPRPNTGVASYLDEPLSPGLPLGQRPAILGLVVPVLVALLLLVALTVAR
jgi:hypothetical protein